MRGMTGIAVFLSAVIGLYFVGAALTLFLEWVGW